MKFSLRALFLAGLLILLALAWRHYLLSDNELDLVALRGLILSWGMLAPLASLGLMVLQSLISPIPFALVVLANGAVFGVVPGVLISSLGELLGALAAYSLARAGLAKHLNREAPRLGRLRRNLGFWQVLGLRLLPGLSVDLVSYACGTLAVPLPSFLLGTTLGLLPRTVLLCAFGEELLQNPFHTLLVAAGCTLLAAAIWWLTRRSGTVETG